jgi:hypothetical protein
LFQEPIQTFGVPFFFVVKEGELLSSMRQRLCKKLEIPEKEFEKVTIIALCKHCTSQAELSMQYKLAVVHSGRANYFSEGKGKYHSGILILMTLVFVIEDIVISLDEFRPSPRTQITGSHFFHKNLDRHVIGLLHYIIRLWKSCFSCCNTMAWP